MEIAFDFKEIVNRLKNLPTLQCYITQRQDGGMVLGDKSKQKYYLLYIQEYNHDTKLGPPYHSDMYYISPNVQFGKNFEDIVIEDKRIGYQIYGIDLPDRFDIDELCKKSQDMGYFESYFKEEVYESKEGRNLANELITLIKEIEAI